MRRFAKALTAAVLAAAGAVGTAATDGTITGTEWLVVAGAAVVAGYGVWQVRNAPPPPTAEKRLVARADVMPPPESRHRH